jgi:hypothetical protein
MLRAPTAKATVVSRLITSKSVDKSQLFITQGVTLHWLNYSFETAQRHSWSALKTRDLKTVATFAFWLCNLQFSSSRK